VLVNLLVDMLAHVNAQSIRARREKRSVDSCRRVERAAHPSTELDEEKIRALEVGCAQRY
jgi:hypothetical protein